MRFYQIKPTIAFTIFFRIGAFVLGILLVSCEKEEEQSLLLEQNQSISLLFDKTGIEKAELKEKLAYKNYHLTNLMEETLLIYPNFDELSVEKSNKMGVLGTLYFKDLLRETLEGKGEREC
ncbi:hypothetical protein PY092_02495 [Muricauda sp. 334s03]|uniref:DUF4296 domain-containing protein n=1 Tax=Flagellimonas yonaguniensis TaxID=3031325 RepID=A0ABT5XUZ8_9FLAO|nr:hypothetical protein [[Muricauda] yonaguniensis]MDF0715005.1 hypothetical protein [[Muricauda] yonaguniensis]